MATLYPTQDAGPTNWSASSWSVADDNAKDQAKPTTGDIVIFTVNSGVIQMDEDSADALAAFTLGGGTLDGNDGTQWTLYVDGDVTYTAGTATQIALIQGGTGNITWNSSAGRLVDYTIPFGGDITTTNTVILEKITVESGGALSGGSLVWLFLPPADNFLDMAGTIGGTVDVRIDLGTNRSNTGKINVDVLAIRSTGELVLTQSGIINAAKTQIFNRTDNTGVGLTLAVADCDLGAVELGQVAGINQHGDLDTGGFDVTIASLTDLAGGASILTIDTSTVISAGTVTLDDIATTISTGEINGDVDLGTNGTLTLSDDATITGAFTLDGGTIDTGVYDLTVTGDVTYTSGTVTALKLIQGGTSDITWNTLAQRLTEYTAVTGATITLTGQLSTYKATVEAGAALSGAHTIYIYNPGIDDVLDLAGTIGGTTAVTVETLLAVTNSGPITANNFTIFATSDTFTQNGVITANTTTLSGTTDNNYAKLLLGVAGSDLGVVTLGRTAGTDRYGILDPNGFDVTMTSLVSGDTGLSNQFDLSANSDVTLSGTFDGTDITCLGPDTGYSIFRDGGGTPVIQDAVFDKFVYAAAGVTFSDAENVNIRGYPPSATLLMLLGVGS